MPLQIVILNYNLKARILITCLQNPLNTFTYIPRLSAEKAGNHFIPGKELHYKYLGHNPQFQLSIPLTLPAMLGRNTTLQSQNRESSPLFQRKVITSIFLTGLSVKSS